jgi:hypothetical protein
LKGLGFDFLKLEKISPESIIDECNCIPRELRTFVGTWNYHGTAAEEEVIEIFKKQRENDFFTELEIFFSKLTPEHQNFFIQETLHKMIKSGIMNAEASVIEGFIDLSLCLRTRYDIRPMVCTPFCYSTTKIDRPELLLLPYLNSLLTIILISQKLLHLSQNSVMEPSLGMILKILFGH